MEVQGTDFSKVNGESFASRSALNCLYYSGIYVGKTLYIVPHGGVNSRNVHAREVMKVLAEL